LRVKRLNVREWADRRAESMRAKAVLRLYYFMQSFLNDNETCLGGDTGKYSLLHLHRRLENKI
jgi:hypothetical protein